MSKLSIRRYLLFSILPVFFHVIKCDTDSESCVVTSGTDDRISDRLLDRLMCDYDSVATPSENTTLVRLGFNITRFSMDVKAGLAYMDVNMSMEWTDPRLKWDSGLYDVDEMVLGRYEIWLPDIEPLNSLRSDVDQDDPTCVVRNTGVVSCLHPLAMTVACGNSAVRWPNDEHTCEVEVSSLSHSSTDYRIQLFGYTTPMDANFTEGIRSPEFAVPTAKGAVPEGWILLNATVQVISDTFGNSFEWTRIVLSTKIKRDIASHLLYLAAPFCVLALLSLSPTLLPATGSSLNARLILGGVAVLGHILQLQNLAAVVPDSIDWRAPYIVCLHRDAMWAACVLLLLSMPGALLLDGGIPGMEVDSDASASASASASAPRSQAKAKPPPAVLVTSAAWLLNKVPSGALLLDNDTDVAALVDAEKDESSGSTVAPSSSSSRSWRGLALVFDRLLLAIFILVYASLLLAYLC